MGNCLVTSLKAVVNNDNLDFLGHAKVNINAPSGSRVEFAVKYSEDATLKIIGSGYFTNIDGDNLGDTFICNANEISRPRLSAGSSYTLLFPKNNLVNFDINSATDYAVPIELSQFDDECIELQRFGPNKAVVSGSLSEMMYNLPEIKIVNISSVNGGSTITGNFDREVGTLNYIKFEAHGWDIYGDVNNFKNWEKIGNDDAYFNWKNSRINGELSTLFDYIAAHGNISTLVIVPNTITTLNGEGTPATQKTVTFSSGSWSIS